MVMPQQLLGSRQRHWCPSGKGSPVDEKALGRSRVTSITCLGNVLAVQEMFRARGARAIRKVVLLGRFQATLLMCQGRSEASVIYLRAEPLQRRSFLRLQGMTTGL